ncbi:hypothetical protein BH11ARM2_BH11ARM2_37570 [soil metagenome]
MSHLFTPEVLAELDEALKEAGKGNSMTSDQVREHFEAKWEAWRRECAH